MKDKKIDVHQMASDLDVSSTHIINLIEKRYSPSLKLLTKIRKVYDIPLGGE
jgi:transcriptional regulator with XRE-family HTH domain